MQLWMRSPTQMSGEVLGQHSRGFPSSCSSMLCVVHDSLIMSHFCHATAIRARSGAATAFSLSCPRIRTPSTEKGIFVPPRLLVAVHGLTPCIHIHLHESSLPQDLPLPAFGGTCLSFSRLVTTPHPAVHLQATHLPPDSVRFVGDIFLSILQEYFVKRCFRRQSAQCDKLACHRKWTKPAPSQKHSLHISSPHLSREQGRAPKRRGPHEMQHHLHSFTLDLHKEVVSTLHVSIVVALKKHMLRHKGIQNVLHATFVGALLKHLLTSLTDFLRP